MLLSVLKAASWVGLLALVVGCGFNATSDSVPSASDLQITEGDPCEPTFLKINEEPLEVWSGHWSFGFDIVLVGCQDELNRVTEEDRQKVADLLQERVGEGGLAFFADQYNRDGRKELVADLNAALDGPVVGDILTVMRSAIEHEPGSD